MKNVVVTGMGIVSCIGSDIQEVLCSLKNGKSGITKNLVYEEMGFRSHVSGAVNINLSELIDRKTLRFMSEASGFGYIAAQEALLNASLNLEEMNTSRIGIVAGSGGASSAAQIEASDIARERGPKRIGPYAVTKTMGSTVSAILGTTLKLKGVNYSISSACSTSAHCIGHAAELIQLGKQDIIIAGGAEQEHWTSSSMFARASIIEIEPAANKTSISSNFADSKILRSCWASSLSRQRARLERPESFISSKVLDAAAIPSPLMADVSNTGGASPRPR